MSSFFFFYIFMLVVLYDQSPHLRKMISTINDVTDLFFFFALPYLVEMILKRSSNDIPLRFQCHDEIILTADINVNSHSHDR